MIDIASAESTFRIHPWRSVSSWTRQCPTRAAFPCPEFLKLCTQNAPSASPLPLPMSIPEQVVDMEQQDLSKELDTTPIHLPKNLTPPLLDQNIQNLPQHILIHSHPFLPLNRIRLPQLINRQHDSLLSCFLHPRVDFVRPFGGRAPPYPRDGFV